MKKSFPTLCLYTEIINDRVYILTEEYKCVNSDMFTENRQISYIIFDDLVFGPFLDLFCLYNQDEIFYAIECKTQDHAYRVFNLRSNKWHSISKENTELYRQEEELRIKKHLTIYGILNNKIINS